MKYTDVVTNHALPTNNLAIHSTRKSGHTPPTPQYISDVASSYEDAIRILDKFTLNVLDPTMHVNGELHMPVAIKHGGEINITATMGITILQVAYNDDGWVRSIARTINTIP